MTIILISHSKALAKEVKDFITRMITATTDVEVLVSGDNVEGQLGNNIEELQHLAKTTTSHDILMIGDLGSSVFAAVTVKEMLTNKNIVIASGPFVEGAFAAYTTAAAGQSFQAVVDAANEFIPKK